MIVKNLNIRLHIWCKAWTRFTGKKLHGTGRENHCFSATSCVVTQSVVELCIVESQIARERRDP